MDKMRKLFMMFGLVIFAPIVAVPGMAEDLKECMSDMMDKVSDSMTIDDLRLKCQEQLNAGMNLRSDEKLFIGWFGPRGLASIVFAVIVINEHLPGSGTIAMTVVCTIILSIIGHGLSANPLVNMLV